MTEKCLTEGFVLNWFSWRSKVQLTFTNEDRFQSRNRLEKSLVKSTANLNCIINFYTLSILYLIMNIFKPIGKLCDLWQGATLALANYNNKRIRHTLSDLFGSIAKVKGTGLN